MSEVGVGSILKYTSSEDMGSPVSIVRVEKEVSGGWEAKYLELGNGIFIPYDLKDPWGEWSELTIEVKVGDTWRHTPKFSSLQEDCKVVRKKREGSWEMRSLCNGAKLHMDVVQIVYRVWEKVRGVEEGEPKSRYKRALVI